MNAKVPLEQAKVFRAVDPETLYSAYNAEKLVSFKLINGLAEVIPVTVIAKDLVSMLALIDDSLPVNQQVAVVEQKPALETVQNQSNSTENGTESNHRDHEDARGESEAIEDTTNNTSEADSENQVVLTNEPTTTPDDESNGNSESSTNVSANSTTNTGSSEEGSDKSSGGSGVNPDDLLDFRVSNATDENDSLDALDRKASEDLAKQAKQKTEAIIDKRAEEILAERQAYVDDANIDDQVIKDLNNQKTRTPEERRAEHQKWAEEALKNTKTRTIG